MILYDKPIRAYLHTKLSAIEEHGGDLVYRLEKECYDLLTKIVNEK
ncbi:hypothetical protein [Niallia circulans]